MNVLRVVTAVLAIVLSMAAVAGCANTPPQPVDWSTGGGPQDPS